MKKLIVSGFIILQLAIFGAAQSGRRVKAAPTPAPAEAEKSDNAAQNSGGYSESAPNSARRISDSPTLRGESKKSKKDSPKQNQTAASTPAADTAAGDEDVVKVETNLITIPVSVRDRNGLYVPSLQQKDFKIFEDGKAQEVAYFGTTDSPFTVVLLIDVSPSTEFKIEQIQDAATAFVNQLEPQDQVAVIEFDSGVHTMTEATTDRDKIYKAIRKTNFGNGTSLYNAVDNALRKQLGKVEGRKAVVLFTDGVDTTSVRASYDKTVREAEESDAVIFPIYFNTYLQNIGIGGGGGGVMSAPPIIGLPGGAMRDEMRAAYALGRAYLQDLAAATGGEVFRSETGGLNAAFEGIAEELRRQYSIGYYPQETGETGQRKQIRVRVDRPNLVVRSRDSYIVGEKSAAPNTK